MLPCHLLDDIEPHNLFGKDNIWKSLSDEDVTTIVEKTISKEVQKIENKLTGLFDKHKCELRIFVKDMLEASNICNLVKEVIQEQVQVGEPRCIAVKKMLRTGEYDPTMIYEIMCQFVYYNEIDEYAAGVLHEQPNKVILRVIAMGWDVSHGGYNSSAIVMSRIRAASAK